MENDFICAEKAFQILNETSVNDSTALFLDVRSNKEYQEGHFRATKNIAILNNEHRHRVGLTYKKEGSTKAHQLGHQLVSGDYKEKLIHSWSDFFTNKGPSLDNSQQKIVFCWRGGSRSQITQQWLEEKKIKTLRVDGGYKAIRKIALEQLEMKKIFLVLTGKTGSGKTELLVKYKNSIDLEGLANHRGSVFGSHFHKGSPSQATFENSLAQSFYQKQNGILIEDESRLIGRCHLNDNIYNTMAISDQIILTVDVYKRAEHIFKEYILETLQKNVNSDELQQHFIVCINRIRKKLGGLQADHCIHLINDSFLTPNLRYQDDNSFPDKEISMEWIKLLLECYYDKLYSKSLAKKERKTLFEGNFSSCTEYLNSYYKKSLR